MKLSLRRIAPAAAVLAALPGVAQAHLVSTGMGPVYDGVSHFALSPEELIPVAALGLFAGLRGPKAARDVMIALPVAWFAGGLAGVFVGVAGLAEQIATAAIFLIVGALLAAEPRVPRAATLAAAILVGLLRGVIDVTGFAASPGAFLALIGVVVMVFVLVALAASVSLPLKATWQRIAVRYAGSCMAALGLLLVGWLIHQSKAGGV